MAIVAVITPAERRALTTPARLRAECDLDRSDAQLEILINRATAVLERYCGRAFARERVRETAEVGVLWLERTPVLQVHAAMLGDRALLTSDYEVLDLTAGRLRYLSYADDYPALTYGNDRSYGYRRPSQRVTEIEVEYTGGYVVPALDGQNDGDVTLPPEIEGACIAMVRASVAVSSGSEAVEVGDGMMVPASSLKSISLGDASWTFGGSGGASASAGGMPAEVAMMLGPYRRIVI